MADFRSRGWFEDSRTERRQTWNGEEADEVTAICPACGDVDCPVHDSAPSEAERTATVIAQVRQVLSAWDASDAVPPRLAMALAALDDAMAALDLIPF